MNTEVAKQELDESTSGVLKITLENYIPWLESKFNDKYGPCLER